MSFFEDIGNFAQGAVKAGQVAFNAVDGAVNAVGNFINPGLGLGAPTPRPLVPSVTNRSVNVGGHDPIQGYDVGVWVEDKGRGHKHVLMGQFTNIVISVKNASEPYLAVGSRQPLYLDGEIQIAFTLEKGLLDTRVFTETFGFKTFDRNNRYIRSPRFKITFAVDPVDWSTLDEDAKNFDELHRRYSAGRFVLEFCKIDTWTMGAQAGRSIVANQWHGVAQQIWAEPLTLDNMPDYKKAQYDSDTGNPIDIEAVPTFYYSGNADQSSTTIPAVNKSYLLYPSWMTQRMLLEAEKRILLELKDRIPFHENPNVQNVFKVLLDAIDRIEARIGNPADPLTKSRAFTDGAIFDGPSHFFGASTDDDTRSSNNEPSTVGKMLGRAVSDRRLALLAARAEILRQLQASTNPLQRSFYQAQFNTATEALEALAGRKSRSDAGDNGVLSLAQHLQREIEELKQDRDALKKRVQGGETVFAEAVATMTRQLEELESQQFLNFNTPSGEGGSFNDTGNTELMPPSLGVRSQDERSHQIGADRAAFVNNLRDKLAAETDPNRRADIQEALNNVLERFKNEQDSRVVAPNYGDLPQRKSSATPSTPGPDETKSSSTAGALGTPVKKSGSNSPAIMELSTAFRARILAELTQAKSDLTAGVGDRVQLSKLVSKLQDDLDIVTSFVQSLPAQGSVDPNSSSNP
jgi:hypothetical protein